MRLSHLAVLLFSVAGLLLAGPAGAQAGASAGSAADSASPVAGAAPAGGLALSPCRLSGVPTEALCGWLARPLDPADPQGRQIQLKVAVLPALARLKRPDPVVFLAGGPGQSAVALAGALLQRHRPLNRRRDLILVDQRGTGESAPLTCPDDRRLPLRDRLDTSAEFTRLADCREALQRLPHGDLRHYTTPIAMQDLDAVRQGLGVARWNLIGASYGTRAGLEYLRQFPQAVRRAVLDGLAPPDMGLPVSIGEDLQAALDAVFESCAAEPACRAAHPQLRDTWLALLASTPRSVVLRDPLSLKRETVTLHREALLALVRGPLYLPALASALPAAITAAARGEVDGLLGLASGLSPGRPALDPAVGQHFSVVCSEDGPLLPAAAQDASGQDLAQAMARSMVERYRQACRGWPTGAVPAAFRQIPAASQPVLLLSGGADPATPPRHGERVAKALGAMARHAVVPAAGHGVLALPCMANAAHRFIEAAADADALALKTDCAAAMPRPLAYLPPDPMRALPMPEPRR